MRYGIFLRYWILLAFWYPIFRFMKLRLIEGG